MHSTQQQTSRFDAVVTTYLWGCSAAFLVCPILSFWRRDWSVLRYPLIALNGLLLAAVVLRSPRAPEIRPDVSRAAMWTVVVTGTAWLTAVALSQHFAFYTGMDFSIFDWMLYNLNHGRGLYSPVYQVFHFGWHQHWILLAFAPLHRIFESPLLLVLAGPLVVAMGMVPLWRIARRFSQSDAIAAIALVAYLACPWTAEAMEGGFRPEVFFPVFGLWLADGWFTGRRVVWIPALILFLAVREDAFIYVTGFAISIALFEPKRRIEAAVVIALGIAVFVIDVRVAQPYFLAKTGAGTPGLMRYWAKYGATTPEIIRGMVTHPHWVLADFLHSRSYRFWVPALFLPALSKRALVALMPALFFLATSEQLRHFTGYSMAVLTPLLFWGIFDGARILATWRDNRWTKLAAPAALLVVGVSNLPILHVERIPFDANRGWNRVSATLAAVGGNVCAQYSLFPHLPYVVEPEEVTEGCFTRPGTRVILNTRFDTFPHPPAQLEKWIADARDKEEFEGGFTVVTVR